jgi:hypothetical protein
MKLGQHVKLKVRSGISPMFPSYGIHTFEGTVIPPLPWMSKNHVRISTGNKRFPYSIINLKDVVGRRVTTGKLDTTEPYTYKSLTSDSSGKVYDLTRDNSTGRITCTCPGFGFRKSCKHVNLFDKL